MKMLTAVALALALAAPALAEQEQQSTTANVPTGADVKGCTFIGYANPKTGELYPAVSGRFETEKVAVCVFPRTYAENPVDMIGSVDGGN